MSTIQSLLSPGDIVAEVGGHIGYLSLHFAQCVQASTDGRVFVFEPGINNLPYLRKNLSGKEGIEIIEAGCGETNGKLDFYMDDLTGQNNSFVQDFEGLEQNSKLAPGVKVTVSSVPVKVLRLDSFFSDKQKPNFIKIDTEGFELSVLKGCSDLFRSSPCPIFMIEVQANQIAISNIFSESGYKIFDVYRNEIHNLENVNGNFFAFHQIDHQERLRQWLHA
jgi:FkbM family methyltransferase